LKYNNIIFKVKTQQQHVTFVLSGHHIDYKEIDIADPANEDEKQFMLQHSLPNDKGLVLPPQVFNENEYCGVSIGKTYIAINEKTQLKLNLKDYKAFEVSIESEELFQYLKLAAPRIKFQEPVSLKDDTVFKGFYYLSTYFISRSPQR
jgi:hypothetical protein